MWITVAVLVIGLNLLLKRTKLGLAYRAVAANAESALIVGIPVKRMLMLGWALAAGIGAIAGAIIAQYRNVLDFNFMGAVLLFGFAAACVGGFDSIMGAVVGGLLVGIVETFAPALFTFVGNELAARHGPARDPHRALRPTAGTLRIETGGTSMKILPRRRSSAARGRPPRPAVARRARPGRVLPLSSSTWSPNFSALRWAIAVTLAIAILGLNIVTGYSGQISVGHSAFFGIGAYTTMILVADHGWPFLATLPVAGALGFAVGFVLGIPALRIRGLYLALITLGLALAFPAIVKSDNFFGIDFASTHRREQRHVDQRRRRDLRRRVQLGAPVVGARRLVRRTTGSSRRCSSSPSCSSR